MIIVVWLKLKLIRFLGCECMISIGLKNLKIKAENSI